MAERKVEKDSRPRWRWLFVAVWALGCGDGAPPTPSGDESGKTIEIIVDSGVAQTKSYRVPWVPEMTVLGAMQQAAKSSGLVFEHRHSGEMAFLDAIGSTRNETGRDGRSWIYHVNGEQADVGFGARKLKPGDVVVWRFQTYNP